MEEPKVCIICGHPGPLEDFYPTPNTKDGRQPYCKECHKKVNRDNYRRRRTLKDIAKGTFTFSRQLELMNYVLTTAMRHVNQTIKNCPANSTMSNLREGLLLDFDLTERILSDQFSTELQASIQIKEEASGKKTQDV